MLVVLITTDIINEVIKQIQDMRTTVAFMKTLSAQDCKLSKVVTFVTFTLLETRRFGTLEKS